MKNKYIYNLLLAAVITLFTASCDSDFLDKYPRNSVNGGNIWKSPSLAKQTVAGVYNSFVGWYCAGYANNGARVWDSYSSIMDIDLNWLSQNSLIRGNSTPSSSQFSSYYQRCYTLIDRANDVIANMDKVEGISDNMKSQYISECKFLRAWGYNRLNIVFKGVPLILDPIKTEDEAKIGRASEEDIWKQVLADLSDVINDPNLPNKYKSDDANYGRITKGAAYALRGQVYLWLKEWSKAEADFSKVGECGYKLYKQDGAESFKTLLKKTNERCDEMIFSIQCEEFSVTNPFNVNYGNRCTGGSMWNNYLPNIHYVESFECKDGSPFNWEKYCPGYNSMTDKQRSVFFLRDNMTDAEITKMKNYGADMSKYLKDGNEARIKKAYEDRDPRLTMAIITPYSTYFGSSGGVEHTYTLRWPYRGYDGREPFDIRTDTNNYFYYLWRKFVPEGNEWPFRATYDLDIVMIRYAQVLLGYAEALNEQGKVNEAVDKINELRERCGAQLLNSNVATTVNGQADMRERIRNEYYWELGGENVMYWNELRWRTWKDKKFRDNTNGLKQLWGTATYTYSWLGDKCWTWPIPASEREKNKNLSQNEGWND